MFIFIYVAPYPIIQNMTLILKLEPDRHVKLYKFAPNPASISHPVDQYHSQLSDKKIMEGKWLEEGPGTMDFLFGNQPCQWHSKQWCKLIMKLLINSITVLGQEKVTISTFHFWVFWNSIHFYGRLATLYMSKLHDFHFYRLNSFRKTSKYPTYNLRSYMRPTLFFWIWLYPFPVSGGHICKLAGSKILTSKTAENTCSI